MKQVALLLLLALSVCANIAHSQANTGIDPNTRVKTSENYEISSLDVLQFRIIGEPETACEVRVAGDGDITLPYIGTVNVKGLTVAKAREEIYSRYASDYYVDPQIDLAIIEYKQRRVNVQGMVNRQGFVIFPPEEKMTLLGAISLAGGWSNNLMADKKKVELTRVNESGETVTYKINATDISQDDWPLKDGDMVYVREILW